MYPAVARTCQEALSAWRHLAAPQRQVDPYAGVSAGLLPARGGHVTCARLAELLPLKYVQAAVYLLAVPIGAAWLGHGSSRGSAAVDVGVPFFRNQGLFMKGELGTECITSPTP